MVFQARIGMVANFSLFLLRTTQNNHRVLSVMVLEMNSLTPWLRHSEKGWVELHKGMSIDFKFTITQSGLFIFSLNELIVIRCSD